VRAETAGTDSTVASPGAGRQLAAPPSTPAVPYAAAQMPGTVKAAAILWIIVGSLGLLGQLMALGNFRPQSFVAIAIAIAFIVAGVQTISGKARDTLWNGIASIVIGALNCGLLLFITLGMGGLGPVVLLSGLPVALGLIVAGILALVGRAGYRAWRSQRELGVAGLARV